MKLKVFEAQQSLANFAAQHIRNRAEQAIGNWGQFSLVLAGGKTPELAYQRLATLNNIDWSRVHLFWGDERMVPHTHPDSNYGMVERSLLSHVAIPAANVHAIETAGMTPDSAAKNYSRTISTYFDSVPETDGLFDLVLLGLGDDGHTASLFPAMPSLKESDRYCVGTPPGRLPPPVDRVTMTFPLLNSARDVCFMVSGESKSETLREVLEGPTDVSFLPAQGIHLSDGEIHWYVDTSAASALCKVYPSD